MMMTSMPYFILMNKHATNINAIWKFRSETQIPVCFTLDAGANVHVLYPGNVSEKFCNLLRTN
jgi:diphosphomevalonate decarboxylase